MTTTTTAGCDACNKSELSILLLRPSPVAVDSALAPRGAQSVSVDENGLISGLVPAQPLSECRYALRLLRAGYVHVYIPSPPPGVEKWLIYRVTDNADLIEHTSAVFAQSPTPPACSRQGHNAAGMRLLRIPQAHKIDVIWIAYSANLWNATLKAQNQANPEAMVQINLATGAAKNPGTFIPTEVNLRSRVLECALPTLLINKTKDHDFPFVSLVGRTEELAEQLKRAAAAHPRTVGRELAVVLKDPVGLATELNALRLRRHELSEQYLLEPKIRHPLEVNRVIQTLKGNLISDVEMRSLDAVAPLRRRDAYEASTVPPATEWQALTAEERKVLVDAAKGDSWWSNLLLAPYRSRFEGDDLGRVVFPDHQQRADAWAEEEVAKSWSKMEDYYDEGLRQQWQANFEQEMVRLHLEPLKRFEADWDIALKDYALAEYFRLHFDPTDANSRTEQVKTGCSPGQVYCQEAWLAFTPEPYTTAPDKTFEAQLDGDIREPDAVMLRAMVGNQSTLIEVLTSDKRDKTFDFMKGLLGEVAGAASDKNPLSPRMQKAVSWLTDRTMFFSAGLLSALGSIAVSASLAAWRLKPGETSTIDAKQVARLARAQSMALIHRASENTLAAAMQGRVPDVPVVLMARFDAETARLIMIGRGQPLSRRRARELARRGQVTMGILTDSQTLRELQAEPNSVKHRLAISASAVTLNEHAMDLKASAAGGVASGAVLTLPVERFYDLYEAQRTRIARAPALVQAWLKAQNSSGMQATRGTVLSMDGRLAIGSIVVQGLGVWGGLQSYRKAGATDDERMSAQIAIADGAAGMLGGFAELSAVAWEQRLALHAIDATKTSVAVPFLRGAGNLLGVAGNVLNAWMSYRHAAKLEVEGNAELALVMRRSGLVFLAGGIPFVLVASDYFLQAAIRRGLLAAGNVAARQVGKIIAVRLGSAAIGLSFPGVGWALTVVAVGQTIYVVMNTPTPFQTWLKGCYFGKPDGGVEKRMSWPQEQRALEVMKDDVRREVESQGA